MRDEETPGNEATPPPLPEHVLWEARRREKQAREQAAARLEPPRRRPPLVDTEEKRVRDAQGILLAVAIGLGIPLGLLLLLISACFGAFK